MLAKPKSERLGPGDEMADIRDSKSREGNLMWVRLPPRAHYKPSTAVSNKTILAYVIGAALGDGNLSRPNGRCTRLRITCDLKYPRLIQRIQDSIQILLPQNTSQIVQRYRYNCVDVSSYSNWWEEWLGWRVGQGSKMQQRVKIPAWIKRDKKYMVACLKGLIETDGSVYLDRGYKMVNFTSTIFFLAQDTLQMILLLGFQPHIYKIRYLKTHKYVIRISKDVDRFIQEVGIDKS